jgi:hypothetical protein
MRSACRAIVVDGECVPMAKGFSSELFTWLRLLNCRTSGKMSRSLVMQPESGIKDVVSATWDAETPWRRDRACRFSMLD